MDNKDKLNIVTIIQYIVKQYAKNTFNNQKVNIYVWIHVTLNITK